MIQLLEYHQIDFKKYNYCIKNSQHPVIYAESWYLDISTNKDWKVFVYDDYQAVMPIPYARLKRSFWKKSIVQPYFCQQLGVFWQKEISQEVFDRFYSELSQLQPIDYFFNHSNNAFLENKNVYKRRNHVLNLNDAYDNLFANFSRAKRQRVRKSLKNDLQIKTKNDLNEFLEFQNTHLNFSEPQAILNQKRKLLQEAINKGIGKIYEAKNNDEVLAVAFFISSNNRIFYVQSASSLKGRDLLAIDGILNFIITENANSEKVLDFEGSEDAGIAKFMSSFGAEEQFFYGIK